MEIRHIETLVVLSEELHFGRAARRLHVVQSAVSKRLRELEEEVGTALVARTRRRVELTPAGLQFLEHARRSLKTLDHAATAAREAAQGTTGHVRLRFTNLTGLSSVPSAIAQFQRSHPAVEIAIEHGPSSANLDAVASGRCDVGFVSLRDDVPTPLACVAVTREPLGVLLPTTHALARRKTLSFSAIRHEPRVVLSRRAEPELHAQHYGPPVRVAVELDQIDSMLAFVAEGFGVACAPRSVTRLSMDGVVWKPIRPREEAGITAVWDPATIAPAPRAFLHLLRAR